MAGISGQQFIGGTYTGFSFPPGSLIRDAIIIAPSTIGEGSILINVTFQCLRQCGARGRRCCPVRSQVMDGVIMTGGTAEYVDFTSTGTWSGVNDMGNTTPPGCVDCAPRGEVGGLAAGTWNGQALVTTNGNITPRAFCQGQQACDNAGQIVLGSNCAAAIGQVSIVR